MKGCVASGLTEGFGFWGFGVSSDFRVQVTCDSVVLFASTLHCIEKQGLAALKQAQNGFYNVCSLIRSISAFPRSGVSLMYCEN